MRDYYAEIGTILGSGGAAYAIVPFGDPAYENAAKTTVTTKGAGAGDGLVFTYYPSGRTTWPHQLLGRQRLARLSFDGTTRYIQALDADFWSIGNGLADEACTFGAWVQLPATDVNPVLFSKWPDAGTGEWVAQRATGGPLQLFLRDGSAAVAINAKIEAASVPVGSLGYVSVTYDGRGGADAADGMSWYLDGRPVASTKTNNASYVATENAALVPTIGARSDGISLGRPYHIGGPLGFYLAKRVLTAADQLQMHAIGRAALAEQFESWRRLGRR